MKLKTEHIEYLEELKRRLTLEEVMAWYYRRSCRRVHPDSDDPVITVLKARRGSVLVTRNEVVVVCNPLDFHLMPPKPDFRQREIIDSRSPYLPGTTIIRKAGRKIYVLYKHNPEIFRLGKDRPINRWGGEILFQSPITRDMAESFTRDSYPVASGHGRILTCAEEIKFSAFEASRHL